VKNGYGERGRWRLICGMKGRKEMKFLGERGKFRKRKRKGMKWSEFE